MQTIKPDEYYVLMFDDGRFATPRPEWQRRPNHPRMAMNFALPPDAEKLERMCEQWPHIRGARVMRVIVRMEPVE